MVQRTKLFGLKKLKKIAGKDPRWFVSPYKVYSSPEQFRLAQALGRRRLLVRGDEKGKSYLRYDWGSMPRTDVNVGRPPITRKGSLRKERKVRAELDKLGNRSILNSNMSLVEKGFLKGRARFIVHPTFLRREISVTGHAVLTKDSSGKTTLKISISFNPSKEATYHRGVRKDVMAEYLISPEQWTRRSKPLIGIWNPRRLSADNSALSETIVGQIVDFIKKGVELKQIKLGRQHTEISFLTWKSDPKQIELYDLIEKRGGSLL